MGKSRKGALCNQLYQYRANSFVVSLFWNACFAYEETDCDKTFPFFNPLMIKLSRLYNATEFLHWWMYTHISLAYKCRCPFKIVATVKNTRTKWLIDKMSSTFKTKAWMRAKKAGFKIVALLIKILLSSVADISYSFANFPKWINVLSDFLLLDNNVAASTLPYWSCFSTGSCPLVWREKSNWSKNLAFLMLWIGWYKLIQKFTFV